MMDTAAKELAASRDRVKMVFNRGKKACDVALYNIV